jgi:hypothetical protein
LNNRFHDGDAHRSRQVFHFSGVRFTANKEDGAPAFVVRPRFPKHHTSAAR